MKSSHLVTVRPTVHGHLFAFILALFVMATGCDATDSDQTSSTSQAAKKKPKTSIFDVRNGKIAINSEVLVEGVVVTGVARVNTRLDFVAQDVGGGRQSGIYFFDGSVVTPTGLAVGDQVTVQGIYRETVDLSSISVSSVTITNRGLTPTVDSVRLRDLVVDAERWESCLTEVASLVRVADMGLGFNEYSVTDGTDSVRVDDLMFNSLTERMLGEELTHLAGIWYHSFGQHKLLPRSPADVVSAGPPAPVTRTIADIQDETSPAHPPVGTVVKIENAVVAALDPGLPGSGRNKFYLQQGAGPFSGIYVWDQARLNANVVVGDRVTVIGTYVEFGGFSEISTLVAYPIQPPTATGQAVVNTPISLATLLANPEPYESVYIDIDHAIDPIAVSDLTPGDPNLNEFEVTQGASNLRVDDLLYYGRDGLAVGDMLVTLRGFFDWRFGGWRLEPRDAADVVSAGPPAPVTRTIADIQDEASPAHPPVGTVVKVENAVVAALAPGLPGSGRNKFYLQQGAGPFSGIYVWDEARLNANVAVGDRVTVIGTYVEFSGFSNIATLAAYPIEPPNATGQPVVTTQITLATLFANPEPYESVYVDIDHAIDPIMVTDLSPGDPDFNEFEVTQGASSLRVDDLLYYGRDGLAVGDTLVTLRGFFDWRFGGWRLEPRDAGDLVVPVVMTIAEIQDEASPSHPPVGTVVKVENAVVAALDPGLPGSGRNKFYLQQGAGPFSGIYVWDQARLNANVVVGDRVTVIGNYVEFGGFSEISTLAAYPIQPPTATGQVVVNTRISLAHLLATPEAYESVYVDIDNATEPINVTNLAPGDPDLNEFEVTQGASILRVDDLLYYGRDGLAVGDTLVTLRGFFDWRFGGWRLEPRDAADVVSAGPPAPVTRTIADIQDETSLAHPSLGTVVKIENAVVAALAPGLPGSGRNQFYLQQGAGPFSGIYVWDQARLNANVAVGDRVTVIGTYVEFGGFSEISTLAAYPIEPPTATGQPVATTRISLATLLANPEPYESVYVDIDHAIDPIMVTDLSPGDPDFNEFEVTQGASILRVDDLLYYGRDGLAVGDTLVTLRGFFDWRFGGWRLEPRDAGDLVK